MNKLVEIAKSWIIAANPNDEQKRIAKDRISICDICDERKYQEMIKLHYCGKCGCPLEGKIFSPLANACPLKKWKE